MSKQTGLLTIDDIPVETLLKCAIRDNKILLDKIKTLEEQIESLKKDVKKEQGKLTRKEQEFAEWKKTSKAFYKGITENEGLAEILKEARAYRREEITTLKKQNIDLGYQVGKYAQKLRENGLL
jgi:transposase-like protein